MGFLFSGITDRNSDGKQNCQSFSGLCGERDYPEIRCKNIYGRFKHSMALPYQEFEDQRSGETLSILTKVREDSVKFITNFINIFFGILVSIIFVSVYAIRLHWSIMPVYICGFSDCFYHQFIE
jgi:ABC-type multidrug transport system fused ATPase/permease subunit